MNRFIVIVLDSFGVGEMDDVTLVRPQDIGANTCVSLLKHSDKVRWPNLFDMGLMNAVGFELDGYKKSETALWGKSKLKHFGADSFFGHQEIAGTNPQKPIFHNLRDYIQAVESALIQHGYSVVRIRKEGLELLKVNNLICVGDNMETDLGQAINVVGALDEAGMDMIRDVGHIVRNIVKVPRVIAFGGSNVSIQDIEDAIFTKDGQFIGVDAPKSGVYRTNYHVEHIGYGVDATKQVTEALNKIGISCYFYGKVANIVANPHGRNVDGVETETIFKSVVDDLTIHQEGFYFVNIQETDLAGHAQDVDRYVDRLNVADQWLGRIRAMLTDNDVLIVMADHGNDPLIGHSKHTREYVPLLIDTPHKKAGSIGVRETMADVGQTVAHYFGTSIEFGTSFHDDLI